MFHSIFNVAALASVYSSGKFGSEVHYKVKRIVRGKEFDSGKLDTILVQGTVGLIMEAKCGYTNPSQNVDYALDQVV